jgi:hypothetical protein
MSNSEKETLNLLAELDAEFGKKPKDRKGGGGARSPRDFASDAKSQLERAQFTSFSDWELHLQMLEANAYAKQIDWRPSWIPEARLTYVIQQHCDCCGDNVKFIGGEYIRFRSKRDRATIIRRAEVVPNLWHYGWDGEPLPDLIDEMYQTVPRCPGCIEVERRAVEIWEAVSREQERKAGEGDQLEIEL